jgi:hypothetical protein
MSKELLRRGDALGELPETFFVLAHAAMVTAPRIVQSGDGDHRRSVAPNTDFAPVAG